MAQEFTQESLGTAFFPIRYKDLTFRLIACLLAAHILVMMGEELSSLEALTIYSYYPTLAINYAIALFLAWIIKEITKMLDKRYSWETNLWGRLGLQFLFGVVLVSVISFFLVFIYFLSFHQNIMKSTYPQYEFPFSVALFIILNGYYVLYYFYDKVKFLSSFTGINNKVYKGYINVLEGKETISLDTAEIACIFIVESGVLFRTWSKKDYFSDDNLDQIESQLDPAVFFRINRRLIAHRTACKSYQPIEYGKLEVTIEPVPLVHTTVSQRKAGPFKEWMK
ncbi:MAG: LytTR family DNA-binding domain-containing protein [Candidatus Pedobacter colombiensis]|uniref:LytTR family DNA-binding domain-containing protein n=1 Tax=Candidatus Pedobacter colombiensis TaxID=3121371 RepID=A0AAJ5WB37_9SPHI|nr:LytTR family DNA-binding domain-containing protein [Pedobacter sp.]WEK21336.1 MAG: LytTR family DNA-binding domain-containing protein [Pedobacter sp.]